jgi:hypothetical protein
MYHVGQKVMIPRSHGGYTLATIQKIDSAVGIAIPARVFVSWTEKANGGPYCNTPEDVLLTKWVDEDQVVFICPRTCFRSL